MPPNSTPSDFVSSSVYSLLVVLFVPLLVNAQPEAQLLSRLRQGDFQRLESETIALQERFSEGRLTEIGLRNAYRPFYNLTGEDFKRLDQWQDLYPKSYAVRLIRGTYYKRAGFEARGTASASQTLPEKFAAMRKLHAIARPELEASLSLTEKPYLSVFHLLDLHEGDRALHKSLMEAGTRMLPTNTLVRARYMRGLTPRWGGSYEEMKAFLAQARTSGATEDGLLELEAIMFDDMGDAALRQGDQQSAVRHFRRALELGQKIGGEVPEQLVFSWFQRCQLPDLSHYCRR